MRRFSATASLALALCCGTIWSASAQAPEAQADEAARPAPRVLFSMTGRESEIRLPRYYLVTTQETFDALWTEHMGPRVTKAVQGWPMPPRVDFESHAAVFIFGGDAINCNGMTVEEIADEPGGLLIRFDAITFQTMSIDGPDLGEAGRPWIMLLIDRPTGPVRLEENVQNLIGEPPIWRKRAVFNADGTQETIYVTPRELFDMRPDGQWVSVTSPMNRLTYCWVDANPPTQSWEGIGMRVSENRDRQMIWASVPKSLHVKTEVDPEIGGIEHLRTADGGTIALACNEAHQAAAKGNVRLVGRWLSRREPMLIVEAIHTEN
mgnify:CR=1 FL=1